MKYLPMYTFAAAIALVACSRHEKPAAVPAPAASASAAVAAPASAAKSRDAELMRAVFGDSYDAQKRSALATILVEGAEASHLMTLNASTDLPDGRTVMIVNGAQADEEGNDTAGHVTPGILNVYLLRHTDSGWNVLERREGVDDLGSDGQIGSVEWVTLAPGKSGFIVSHGGIWQGYWIQYAVIFDLDAGVRSLGSFKEGSGNEGACVPTTSECWATEGKITFASEAQPSGYRDIVVNFNNKRYTVKEDKDGSFVEQVQSNTKSSARYHFDGKAYVLAAGTNPVQDI